jgi:cobalt-zinc-cadmium efflux system outer membrane protein
MAQAGWLNPFRARSAQSQNLISVLGSVDTLDSAAHPDSVRVLPQITCFVRRCSMLPTSIHRRPLRGRIIGALCVFTSALLHSSKLEADPPGAAPALAETAVQAASPQTAGEPIPQVFTRASAIGWALRNNPDLAALRQQHGFAAAAVIIANTYPFNPSWTSLVTGNSGPAEAGITNRVYTVQGISMPLEIRGQGRYRLQAAYAGLNRTDWEIADQETLLAIRVLRAFDFAVYQQAKLQLAEEALRLQQETVEQVQKLFRAGSLRSPDALILAQSEIDTSSAALYTTQSAQAKAQADLRAALGLTSETVKVSGTLAAVPVPDDPQPLLAEALAQRPDLHARQAAVREAEGNLHLAVADRYGNIDIGPSFEYNETSVSIIGAQMVVPLPVLNTHRGEILQHQATRTRAALDLRSLEVAIQQQVYAALGRLGTARVMTEMYQTRVVPNLETALQEMQTLFNRGGVDLLKVIDVRRRLLSARSGYLDALYELQQARTDLAAAVADLGLALDAEPIAPGH